MRKVGSMACALLVAACGSAVPQADNVPVVANAPVGQADAASPEPARDEPASETAAPAATRGNACRTQDGRAVAHKLKALGTEPFWAAVVDGRCVTYTTPEDQNGTRIWTRVSEKAGSAAWEGALRGKQFQLTIRPKADCSDGMSDKSYPMEAVLRVDGETRHGCAEQL